MSFLAPPQPDSRLRGGGEERRERGRCRRTGLFLSHNLCDSGSGVIRTEGSESLSGPVEREPASLTEAGAEAGPETAGPARAPGRAGGAELLSTSCWSPARLEVYKRCSFLESWFPGTPLPRTVGDPRRF